MTIKVPELSLIILIGVSGSGKSTFARANFKSSEVLSSDACRYLVADNENDQSATNDAFEVLHFIAAKRLAGGRLTVIDATNTQLEARKSLVQLARQYHCIPVAVVLDIDVDVCVERNRSREDRQFGPHVIRRQQSQLRRSLRGLRKEGLRHVYILKNPAEVNSVSIVREPLWNNRKFDSGPFDIIGDVHGCFEECRALLKSLGYTIGESDQETYGYRVIPPEGRKAVFLGDLVDRGPGVVPVLRLVMSMVESGTALCVPGNHDLKLVRKLRGKNVKVQHGLAESLEQLERESPEFRDQTVSFLDGLVSHYVLDDGKLVVAHAGMKEVMQGRGSAAVRDFALYGETTGETDEFGLPVRYPWAQDYRGRATVVYGHTPVPEAEWLNRTINIDTGCVFGGKLTALRYPEMELVTIPAAKEYAAPVRPLSNTINRELGEDLLRISDVNGKRIISTRLRSNITLREENSAAALEAVSRFAVDPHWLIYLPPTMSPTPTSALTDYLEYPTEAFSHYAKHGVGQIVCQEKHMGSRVIAIVCREPETAQKRFGAAASSLGVCYTRTGRPFFKDPALEQALLDRIRCVAKLSGLWDELETRWMCLDCELMPWSAKAQDLIRRQYAPVGVSSTVALHAAKEQLARALTRGIVMEESQASIPARISQSLSMCEAYGDAYRRYCWQVNSLHDLKLAPFHIMASEGHVHTDKAHSWHVDIARRMANADCDMNGPKAVLKETHCRFVDMTNHEQIASAVEWWETLTAAGGEGMVVKPANFVVTDGRGLLQPALKCRGREYLRIIYGPEYTAPENMERLRARSLGAKRSLALREFALGVESLERFVQYEPLYRVHECAFAVLALESEPVDPRL